MLEAHPFMTRVQKTKHKEETTPIGKVSIILTPLRVN